MFYAVSLLTGFVVLHFAQVLDLYGLCVVSSAMESSYRGELGCS